MLAENVDLLLEAAKQAQADVDNQAEAIKEKRAMASNYQGFRRILATALFAVNFLLPAHDRYQAHAQVASFASANASPSGIGYSSDSLLRSLATIQPGLDDVDNVQMLGTIPTELDATAVQPAGYGCSQCDSGCNGTACSCQGSGTPNAAPCVDCPRITTLKPYHNINVYGALVLDMVLSDARAVAPGTPYFLLPGPASGFDQNTANFHARQSYLGAQVNGPRVGSFQSGGNILVYFYNDNAFADTYGILPLQAYGELRNERWRFAAGYQFDVFNPGVPTILPFSALLGSGNTGNAARGQLRVERYFATTQSSQWTLQCALSEPITTLIDPTFGLSEDNGWPNFEARLAYALGAVQANGQRPFEIGVSGIVGQIRNTVFNSDAVALQRFVTDVWGVGADFRWRISDFLGVTGEVYSGQGLGTYNGGALQLVNPDEDFGGIRSTGGFGEVYTYWTPRLHTHFGFGIDDPLDSTVAVTPRLLGRTLNSTGYANAIFDVTPSFRVAFEVARRETRFLSPAVPDNAGTFFQSQVAFTF